MKKKEESSDDHYRTSKKEDYPRHVNAVRAAGRKKKGAQGREKGKVAQKLYSETFDQEGRIVSLCGKKKGGGKKGEVTKGEGEEKGGGELCSQS